MGHCNLLPRPARRRIHGDRPVSTSRSETRPLSICGVRSIHFGVADFDATSAFFTAGWGLSPVATEPDRSYLRGTGAMAYVVALHRHPQTQVLRIDLCAPDRTAIEAIHARLAAAGRSGLTTPAEITETGAGYGFQVRDPDGRLLMIVADDAAQAETADRTDVPRKISHIVMNTPDVQRLESFYTGDLGARIVDRTRRIHFVNCNNADHHSIALVPSKLTALHHIAFEMPSFDALMRGVGRLRERGTAMGWGVGRHGPGNNIFAYFIGPEFIPLEYTTEVQQIDETYRVGRPEDWTMPPGRMDLWGATPPPSPDMMKAEQSVEFARAPA
jgi:catechol-2,3-dioxygenase